jgi:hypothetical protein
VPNPLAGLLGGGAGGAPGEPNPRPYAQVITPQARSKAGLVTTHQLRGRLYFEIPARELGKDMLLVRSIRGMASTMPLFGTLGGDRLVRWERKDHRILLRAVSHQYMSSDTAGPINRAVGMVTLSPILAAFNVEAYGRDSAPVVDVSRMFTGGVADLVTGIGVSRVAVDPTRSFIERVATYDRNVEVVASQTFTPQPTPAIAGLPAGLGGGPPTATTELYHFSMVKLPERPMPARLHDDRVGYFSNQQLDFGSREHRVARRRLINRWRLECSDQKVGELCVPRKAITYYVDPATPAWLVPWIKAGIEEWQPAFEAAGFHKGIVAAEAPKDDPDFSGENASVAMVRWVPSQVPNAVGPSIIDPRSGEILDADVQMLHQVTNLLRGWYFSQVGHLDPRVQKLPMPDSLMGRLVQNVVAHEVGHTLGFPHNTKASSMYPLDSVRSKSWVARMGHSPSIMDYARFNYVAQPEDGIAVTDLVPRLGPYDKYAVMWGYKPIAGAATPEQEKPTLDTWARMQDTIPWYRFADDAGASVNGADPGEAYEAVGDADAVRATELGMKNLRRVAKLLEPATTATAGESYDDLQELYGTLVGQWVTELGHVARVVGGSYKQEKVVGQKGVVFTPLPASRQRAAVAFLNQHAFRTPDYLIDPSVLRKFEATGSLDRIGAAQRNILNLLLANQRLARLIELEALAERPSEVYTLGQMLGDVRRGVWSEAHTGAAIDPYRRRLQRAHLELLAQKINPPAAPAGVPPQLAALLGGGSIADARALLRGDLMELDRDLAGAVGRTTDRTTRLHLQDARDQIDRILHPQR